VIESADISFPQRLIGQLLPSVQLPSTHGDTVDLASASADRIIIYCYPRTSEPGKPAPTDWDVIPGARGCTPQACTFRDHYLELQALGADVFGLSTQSTAYQAEMSTRLHLPFSVLSDQELRFANALQLPMFEVDGMHLIKRLTIIARGRTIEAVLYPVVRPEESANDVVAWIKAHPPLIGMSTLLVRG
jgi:peroxiredoxin